MWVMLSGYQPDQVVSVLEVHMTLESFRRRHLTTSDSASR